MPQMTLQFLLEHHNLLHSRLKTYSLVQHTHLDIAKENLRPHQLQPQRRASRSTRWRKS